MKESGAISKNSENRMGVKGTPDRLRNFMFHHKLQTISQDQGKPADDAGSQPLSPNLSTA